MDKNRTLNYLFLIMVVVCAGVRVSVAQVIFNYTGGPQNYVVPAGVTVICFTVEGAQGNGNASNLMLGGLGGRTTGQLLVTPGQVLQINVGGGGLANSVAGGWNGGAAGGITQANCCPIAAGGGGGGGSDIRINPYTLNDRVTVGGGGGGTGGNRSVGCSPGCGGGGGGGYYGGGGGGAYGGSPGFGGSQVAGGAGGPSCCGCPNGPTPGNAGVFGAGGSGGTVGCNNQAANNPGCAGGVGGAAVGGQGPNCTGGTGCPSTWAGASGAGGSNFNSGAIIGPTSVAGVKAGTGRVVLIPNCCTQPTVVPVANPNPICNGQTATLTATGAGIGGTYTWNPGPITGSMVTVAPVVTTIYTVTGQNTLNCTGSQTIQLVVNPGPTINPTSNSPVCIGNPINLFANPTAPAPSSYTWTGPNAFTSNLQNPTIGSAALVNTGTYTLKATSAAGCTTQAVVIVNINPSPTVNPSSNSPVCQGQVLNLFANPVAPAPSSYTWTGPNAFSSNAQNNSIVNVTPAAAGNYTLKVTSASGCTAQAIIAVVINPTPNVTASSATVCPGFGATLNGGGATTYTWNPGNVISPSPSFTPPSTQVYTVVGSSAAGCTASATGTITVNPSPVPLPNSNSPVCTGGNINLTVNAFSTYTWTGPNAFSSNVQNPTIANATTLQAGSYTVKVTSALGCTAQAVVNVVVNASPTITVGNTGPYCAGSTIQLTVTSSNTYTWNGPLAYNSNVQNPTIANSTTNMAGPYTVTVAAVGGCISTGTTNVVVNATPSPTASSNSPVCLGNQINLFANPAAVSYTWAGPNAFASNAQNPTIASALAASAGNYTVTVTNASGCTNSSVVNVVVNPLPVIVVNNPITCVGSSMTLTANGGTAYAWTGPNAFVSAVQNPVFASAQTSLNGNYTVIVTSAQGCTNSAVATISVVSNPSTSVAGNNTLCSQNFNGSPATTTLTAGGATSYQWTLPVGFSALPNLSSNPISLTPPVTTTSLVASMTVVGTAGSCTSQAVYQVTVYPNPTIAVTSASMCAGTQVTLTANNASTYTWSPATNLNTTSGPVVVANPSVTTVYSVVGSSVGCNSQTQNSTASVVPNPTVTINPNPALICLGSSVNLTASGATNYSWTPATALTSTNTANTTANPTVTTTYSVLGSQNTCTHLATVQVSVIGLPTVSVVGNNTLCSQNFNGSPNITTLTASGAGTYVWTLAPGFAGNPSSTSNPLTVTAPLTTTSLVATMTVVGTAGTCTNQAVYTLTVLPNPTITATSGSMCAGTQVTLTANNATTYTWSPSATLNTANGPNVIASPAITTVYSVIGGSLGCNSQAVNATANVVPNPTVTVNPNPGVICLNDAVNLTASGATNYTWSPNTALTSTNTAFTTANPTVTTVYTVIGEAATCTHVTTMTVQVLPLPTVNIVPSSPTLCMNNFNGSPNTVTLTANGASTYTWMSIVGLTTNTLNGAQIIGTSNGNPIATGSVIGTNGTCSSTATFTLNAIPNPVIATTSGSMCAGTSVSLTAANAQTYTWSPSATLNTANGPIVIASPTVTTMYSVIGSSVGCQGQTQNAIATVVQNPTVFITPFTPTICFGTSINLTGNGANNYTWTPNTAISATVGNVVTVNPTVNTTYQLIGEASTCTHVAAIDVTVVPLPIINIALSSPTMCMNNYNGSPNTINVTANGAVTYNWTGFTNITSNTTTGPNIIVTAIPGQPFGTGTVVGSAQTCTSSATFSVLAAPNPIISVPSQSVCQFHSVAVSATGADTYVWAPANTLNSPTGATVIASPTLTTIYSVIGSSMNCQSPTETTTVTVVANPQIVISPVTPTICAGSPIGLTAFGANNYTWTPATNINTVNGSFVIVSPTVTTYYSVLGEAATCTSTAVRMVSVIPLPDLQAVSQTTVICAGDKLPITANGATSYTWSPNFGLANLNSNFVVATPTMPITYTVIGTNGVCTKTITFAVDVKPRPVLNLTTDRPKICQGESASIFVSGCSSYSWHPSPFTNATNTTMATVTPTTSFNFSVTGYNGDTLGGGCPFTKEILIEVVPQVTATASWSQSVCQGESVKLKAEGSNTYQWIPFEGLNNTKIAQPYASPSITTVYTVMVSNGGFCGGTATVLVKVAPMPTVTAGSDMTFNSDEVMMLNAKGSGTLTWTFGENIICAVCPNTQITATRSGVYHVEATNEFGCKAGDDVWIEVTNDYPIFIPNSFTPNYDGLNDNFLVYGDGIIEFEMLIFDRWQHQIFSTTDQKTGWNGEYKGQIVKNDSYTYLINYTTYDNKKRTKTGYVIVVRED